METTSCIKDVVVAANQYRNNTNDANLVHLQRQIDVLISVTNKGLSLGFFDHKQLLPTECITCLVDILNDSNTKLQLVQKCLVLLNNLANDEEIRQALHSTFHITPCLAFYVRTQLMSSADSIAVQCLRLLQRITYKCRISYQESYVEDLVKFVIKHIQEKESELTQPCLGLLANMCHHNFSVQAHVKSLENLKYLYKSLIGFLSHKNQTNVICSLSILSSLCLHETLGEKLFNAQNINQTFQLMFNILVNGDAGITRCYAVDLFKDLIRHTKIQDWLVRYNHLEACIKELLLMLCNTVLDVSKLFELLLSFCSVNGIRCVVCRSLLESKSLRNVTDYSHLLSHSQITEPFFAVVHWAGQSVETHDAAPMLALELLREVYQEMIDQGEALQAAPRTDLVMPMLTEILMAPMDKNSQGLGKNCQKAVRALKLMTTLCSDDTFKSQVAESVDTKTCDLLLNFQFQNNPIVIRQSSGDPHDWSEAGTEVMLYTLDLMSHIKGLVQGMERQFVSYLQDDRLVPFLASGITSDQREKVQITLKLIGKGAVLPEFPAIVLGDSIAANNANKIKRSDSRDSGMEDSGTFSPGSLSSSKSFFADKENMPLKPRKPCNTGSIMSTHEDVDYTIQSLIEKMQSGMEKTLRHQSQRNSTNYDVKDLRASEIINVYEHKLQSLQTKENHLQDLLEAKAMALAQADRLIAQYRCRKAQSEAEAHKLRSLLGESERRSEEHREQLNEIMLEKEQMQNDIEQLVQENNKLDAVAEEHKELSQSYAEQTQKLENTLRALNTLKQEHKSLSEMHEMLRRHNETLKQQFDSATEQVAGLEEERKNLARQLKEKEAKLSETAKTLSKTEDRLKKTTKDRDELETAIDKLRAELSKAEQSKKKKVPTATLR